MLGRIRFVVLLFNLILISCGGGKTNVTPESEIALYQKSLSAYQNKNYDGAIGLFQQQVQKFPSGTYVGEAHYYEGRSFYAKSNYTLALEQFKIILNQFNSSIKRDSAQYWLAKSYHKQGLFDLARTEYTKVILPSQWADNAVFQIGKTHFDQAMLAGATALAYSEFSFANTQLQAMITNPAYLISTSFDDAAYFLGRSLQEQGNLLLKNTGLSLIETSTSQYGAARVAFGKVVSPSIYTDDASYQLARIDFENAAILTDPVTAFSGFEVAVNNFRAFINNAAFLKSNRLDAAFYYLAKGLQERGNLILNNLSALTTAGLLNTTSTECITSADCLLNARSEYARISSNSIFYDDGLYYTARSYQQEGNLAEARISYQLILTSVASSKWVDDSTYYLAKIYYDTAKNNLNPAVAMADFISAYNEFASLVSKFPKSNRVDNSLYYQARSVHQQALLVQNDASLSNRSVNNLLVDARTVYQYLLDTQPLSQWADNALHQQASSYYDEAAVDIVNLLYPESQDKINTAISLWQSLLVHPVYQNQGSADNAQYSLGKAYQLVLSIPVINRIALSNGVDFTTTTSGDAILEYNKLISNFSGSRWIDNAYFNSAVIYNNDALATAIIAEKQIAFDKSLFNFNTVVKSFSGQSYEDDAANGIAMIYHQAGPGGATAVYCSAENNWLTLLKTISIDSVLITNADSHLIDLNLVASQQIKHPCQGVQTINLTVYPAP